ncbi:hypothetical protein JOF36_007741 [Pseudonocardia parietis]|uniref:Uncharacterized protein n=1 Tax=Pseudonocardia parietis TaxID=570936 RepID=A0ABS4W6X8_9PSEU|nr:hypothetical protein [Pseudonocardia parietis]
MMLGLLLEGVCAVPERWEGAAHTLGRGMGR